MGNAAKWKANNYKTLVAVDYDLLDNAIRWMEYCQKDKPFNPYANEIIQDLKAAQRIGIKMQVVNKG